MTAWRAWPRASEPSPRATSAMSGPARNPGPPTTCAPAVPAVPTAAVAEQVGRHDGVILGEHGHRVEPLLRAAGDAVDEQDHRTLAGDPVAHAVAVKVDLLGADCCRRLLGHRSVPYTRHLSVLHDFM